MTGKSILMVSLAASASFTQAHECFTFKHVQRLSDVGIDKPFSKRMTCDPDVQACMIYQGRYMPETHYMNGSANYWLDYYDGGCGPLIAWKNLERVDINDYTENMTLIRTNTDYVNFVERCGRRKLSLLARSNLPSDPDDTFYRVNMQRNMAEYPYEDPTIALGNAYPGILDDQDDSDSNAANSTDLVAKFLEEFMCEGLSPAVCYDASRKTPEWLDCKIDIRATIC